MSKRQEKTPEQQLVETVKFCEERYRRWHDIYQNGCYDPTWTDGVNLNLVRQQLQYAKRCIAQDCNEIGCELPEIYYKELPPEVDDSYMANPNLIRENAKVVLSKLMVMPEYIFLKEQDNELNSVQKEKICYYSVLGYVTRLKAAIAKDDLVCMRLYRIPERYFDSIKCCAERAKSLKPEPIQLSLFSHF